MIAMLLSICKNERSICYFLSMTLQNYFLDQVLRDIGDIW